MAATYYALGTCYISKGTPKKAIQMFEKAEALYAQMSPKIAGVATAYVTIARAYLFFGDTV